MNKEQQYLLDNNLDDYVIGSINNNNIYVSDAIKSFNDKESFCIMTDLELIAWINRVAKNYSKIKRLR